MPLSPLTGARPEATSTTPTAVPELGSSGQTLETPDSSPVVEQVVSPEGALEPPHQPISAGETEGEKAGHSLPQQHEPPEEATLTNRPMVEPRPTTVGSPGSKVSSPENLAPFYPEVRTWSPSSGAPCSPSGKPDGKVPDKASDALDSSSSRYITLERRTGGSGGEEDSNERTTETGSDILGSTLGSTDSTEISYSGLISSETPVDQESSRTQLQMPFRKNKGDSPSLSSREASSSSAGSSDESSCSSGTESSSSGASSGDKSSPRDPPEKVMANSSTKLSITTDRLKSPIHKVGTLPPGNSSSGTDLGVSGSRDQTGKLPGKSSVGVTRIGGTLPAGADEVPSSSPVDHPDNLREVGHHLQAESKPSGQGIPSAGDQYSSVPSTPGSQASVRVYISPEPSLNPSGKEHSPDRQDRGRRGQCRTRSTRDESRKESSTTTQPSPGQSPSVSPSLSGTTVEVAQATEPGGESPMSTLNWSSDSSRQNTVLMSSSPAFSLPGEFTIFSVPSGATNGFT